MKTFLRTLHILVMLTVLLGLLGAAVPLRSAAQGKAQPQLVRAAQRDPNSNVSVIVQKKGQG